MTEITQADRDASAALSGEVNPCACEMCKGTMQEAFARHRLEERAKIVAWLREQGIAKDEMQSEHGWWDTSTGALYGASILEAIEAGEHLK